MDKKQNLSDRRATFIANQADAGSKTEPNAIPDAFDTAYRDYVEALPGRTAAILAGQKAWRDHVA